MSRKTYRYAALTLGDLPNASTGGVPLAQAKTQTALLRLKGKDVIVWRAECKVLGERDWWEAQGKL